MDTNKTNMQLIKELPQDVKDDFILNLAQDAQCFADMAGANINLYYYSWFSKYVLSDDFAKLSKAEQKEVLDHYENTKYAITLISEFYTDNNLIVSRKLQSAVMQ